MFQNIKLPISYKQAMVIPLFLVLFSIGVLANSYLTTGEIVTRSFELKGGVLISIATAEPVDIQGLESQLKQKFGGLSIREIKGLSGSSIVIQGSENIDSNALIAELGQKGFDTKTASVQKIGAALGASFWQQAQMAVGISFVLMFIIVFVIFRQLVPSLNVIFAAAADIIVTLAFMQLLGIELSLPSLGALLMLLGYSIDTDIVLATRVFKVEKGNITEKIRSAFITGMTMTLTALAALIALYFVSASPVITSIASVMIIGLCADIVHTWLQNASLLRWSLERKGLT
ncbi:MAG: protein translocase subunit SecF [Candidatus Aenigmarchaeota archaeon]|nr:protein translocase subunit SecF [Candidatus Aenigmarchaeota archaeon]